MPGQTIHASVCFIKPDIEGNKYLPKATFHRDLQHIDWSEIVGVGHLDSVAWADGIEQYLELDLFDIPGTALLVDNYLDAKVDSMKWSDRLEFIASIRTSASLAWICDLTTCPLKMRVHRLS